MDLTCPEEAKRDVYRRPHVTYISEKVDDSDLVFRGWWGVYKRYLLVKFDGPAMCISILVCVFASDTSNGFKDARTHASGAFSFTMACSTWLYFILCASPLLF